MVELDEDEEYYADDKFVYEDVAEDRSSEDPEQKFLKDYAERTARISDEKEIDATKNEDKNVGAKENSLELTIRENRRMSQSQSNMAESRDKDDLISRHSIQASTAVAPANNNVQQNNNIIIKE